MEQLQEEKRDELTAIREDIYSDVKVSGCWEIRRLFAPLVCCCFLFVFLSTVRLSGVSRRSLTLRPKI